MAADFNKPVTTDAYTAVLSEIRDLMAALAVSQDPAVVTPSNTPTSAVRWNASNKYWEKYNGATWAALEASYAINVTSLGGNAAAAYALLANPVFTGDPKAPTPLTADNDTSIATTAFVKNQAYLTSATAAATYAPLGGGGTSGTWGISISGNAATATTATTAGSATTAGTATALASTLGVAGGGTGLTTLTANNVILGNGTSTPSFVAPGASGNLLTSNGTTWASAAPPSSSKSVQTVYTNVATSTTGTTVIPQDDTVPQNTEGDQYMSLAITPTNAANLLRITVTIGLSNSAGGMKIAALFQDSTANALSVAYNNSGAANAPVTITWTYTMAAGTTSATTFKVRGGGPSGTTTFNGASGSRIFGGSAVSSIVIEEVTP